MAKPILFAKIPGEIFQSYDSFREIEEHLRLATNNEYHILLTRIDKYRDIEIQVFYEKDFTEVNYEELKRSLMNHSNT
jgi:hypothetical protein